MTPIDFKNETYFNRQKQLTLFIPDRMCTVIQKKKEINAIYAFSVTYLFRERLFNKQCKHTMSNPLSSLQFQIKGVSFKNKFKGRTLKDKKHFPRLFFALHFPFTQIFRIFIKYKQGKRSLLKDSN